MCQTHGNKTTLARGSKRKGGFELPHLVPHVGSEHINCMKRIPAEQQM